PSTKAHSLDSPKCSAKTLSSPMPRYLTMRRRKFIQAIAAIPAAAVAVPLPLIGQYQRNERQGNATGSSVGQTPPQGQSAPVLKTVFYSEAGTTPVPNFFSEIQFSALS